MSEIDHNCGCEVKNPLQRDGTSQAERLLKALDPTYVQVDERNIDDLLRFALKYAEKLNFYNEGNQLNGNWYNFLAKDVSVLCANISGTNLDQLVKDFRSAFQKLDLLAQLNAPSPAEITEAKTTYLSLYKPVIDLINLLGQWHDLCDEKLTLRSDLSLYFTSVFSEGFSRFRNIDAAAANPLYDLLPEPPPPGVSSWAVNGLSINSDWLTQINTTPVTPNFDIFVGLSPAQKHKCTLAAAYFIRGIFDEFYMALLNIISRAPEYLLKSLEAFPYHKAQAGLFLAFLQLFGYAQKHINKITRRHLDFYFDRVLKLERKPAVADSVHLIFELAANVAQFEIKEDTLLKAGKDALGKPLSYGTDDTLVFNKAQATEFKSIYIQRYKPSDGIERTALFASPVANSANGLGAALDTALPQWEAFGSPQLSLETGFTPAFSMPDATVGFAIASPQLILREGERKIIVTVTLKNNLSGFPASPPASAFNFQITTAKSWFTFDAVANPATVDIDYVAGSRKLIFTLTLLNDDPATSAWNSKVHGGTYSSSLWPVMRVTLNNNIANGNIWQLLQNAEPESVNVTVEVKNLQSIIIQNDAAKGDPAKPFQPFGVQAPRGAAFYIGSDEILYKSIYELNVTVDWHETPELQFKDHYQHYFSVPATTSPTAAAVTVLGGNNPFANNQSVLATVSYLSGRVWKKPDVQNLPTPGPGIARVINNTNDVQVTLFQNTATDLHTFSFQSSNPATQRPIFNADLPDPDQFEELKEFTTTTQRGFIRLQLGNLDFQHNKYAAALMRAAQLNSTPGTPQIARINPPYTPIFKSISASYKSGRNLNTTHDQFYLVHPFGEERVTFDANGSFVSTTAINTPPEEAGAFRSASNPAIMADPGDAEIAEVVGSGKASSRCLVPKYTINESIDTRPEPIARRLEGMLFIGLKGLNPQESVSMLVQTVDDSADPNQNQPEVHWSYLRNNEWVALDQSMLISDTTNGFINSGLIELSIPEDASNTNSILTNGLHWLRAATVLKEDPVIDAPVLTLPGSTSALSNVLNIHTQAIKASFRNNNNDPEHLREALPAATISKLENSNSAIKSVSQPYASFGGKLSEAGNEYYRRVSERLRHKGRAITIWDYERLVLENFPSIYKVKCINHMRHRIINNEACFNQMAGGGVTVIVVSNLRNQNLVNPLQPTTSTATREEIRLMLKKRNSRFADVSVINPVYEEVQVHFKVYFGKKWSSDKGYYSSLLNEDIKKFLSPWAYAEGTDIRFGGKLHASYILNFIEEREYVDYITDFKMYRAENGEVPANSQPLEEISASQVYSILVSAPNHIISY
ncbi:MAG: baseplate J/gp47 family protein [Bacteroidetes bacterium]|nr:baseplate J/gp47 family protein [Bacteroidota bacterium]